MQVQSAREVEFKTAKIPVAVKVISLHATCCAYDRISSSHTELQVDI